MPEISPSLRSLLSCGKYSRWAADLDEETLYALCWFVGEFAVRIPKDAHAASSFAARGRMMSSSFAPRSDTGLEVIQEIHAGKKFSSFDEIRDRLHQGLQERNASLAAADAARGARLAGEDNSAFYRQPVVLTGKHVILEPLRDDHAARLFMALEGDEEIWRYMPSPQPRGVGEMRAWIAAALQDQARGSRLPFVVLDRQSRELIGTTSYLNLSPENRSLDIGWTWYRRSHWRSGVNTECKYLLLKHAFQNLRCIRVQFRADARNERSRRAIERIGGVFEGILRKVQILHDGHERDVAIFSILGEEWEARKVWFEQRLDRQGSSS